MKVFDLISWNKYLKSKYCIGMGGGFSWERGDYKAFVSDLKRRKKEENYERKMEWEF